MGEIYKKSNDVHVSHTMIYSKDNKAYKDPTCDVPYKTFELKEAFLKGAIVDIPAKAYDNDDRLTLIPSSFGISSINGKGYVNCSIPRIRKNQYHIYPGDESGFNKYDSNTKSISRSAPYVYVYGEKASDNNISFGVSSKFDSELEDAIRSLQNELITISVSVEYYSLTKTDNTTWSLSLDDDIIEIPVTVSSYTEQRIYLTTYVKSKRPKFRILLNEVKGSSPTFVIHNIQVEKGPKMTDFEEPKDSDWIDVVKSMACDD